MITRWHGAAASRWPRLAVGSRDRCRSTQTAQRGLAATAQAVQREELDGEADEEYPQRWQPSVAKRQRARAAPKEDRAEAYRKLFPRPADLPPSTPLSPLASQESNVGKAEDTALHIALSQLYLVEDLATPEQRQEALEQASLQSHLFSRTESKKLLRLIARYGASSEPARRHMDDELFYDFAPPSLLLPPLDNRTVRPSHVRAAETAFQEALLALENSPPEQRSERIRIYLNRMLYLSARIPSKDIFERVRALFKRHNIGPDDYTTTARIMLLDRTDQLGKLPALWQDICSKGDPPILFFNAVLWAYAKRGQWDVVGQLYNRILGNTRREGPSMAFPDHSFFSAKALPVPAQLRPGKDTYQCLVLGLAHHGNLHSALHVLQDLTRDPAGLQPDVADFLSLFQGFARFGEASSDHPDRQHERAGMPQPEDFPHIPVTSHIKPRQSSLRLSEIWTRETPLHGQNHDRWTLETLDRILESLLSMVPADALRGRRGSRDRAAANHLAAQAPTSRGVFSILMAYSRCTNGNIARLQEVFARLQAKYGEGNAEGWHGWRMDARLRRLVWIWREAERAGS